MVDGDKLLGKFLRDHAQITALIGRRVVVDTPKDTSDPWIRYTLLDAPNATRAQFEHLIAFLMQLDCYAGATGGQPEAKSIAITARELITGELIGSHPDGVVTGSRILGHIRLPDQDFEPPRERVILTVEFWAHP